jgi:tetratricopeptide (TPR) repeat protein
MRITRITVAAGLVSLLLAAPSRAGIYLTADADRSLQIVAIPAVGPKGVSPAPLTIAAITMGDLMQLRDDTKETQKRKAYLVQRDQLREKDRKGTATLDDRINLGAILIRLGDTRGAIELLHPLARDRSVTDFRVSASLGMAYLLSGESRSASDNIEQAIFFLKRAKPGPGLTGEQLAWYLQSEKALLKLARLRRQEMGTAGQPQPIKTVDNLFDVRFVADSGEYEAGKLAAEQRENLVKALAVFQGKDVDKLSAQERERLSQESVKEATALVQQLLFWMPEDSRLYWLLGELLNAGDQVREAQEVLYQCGDARRLNAAELREHRQKLQLALVERKQAAEQEQTASDSLPDRSRLLLVGGGVGVVVVLLGYFQVREMRRRRQARG